MFERTYASQMKVFGSNDRGTIETIHMIGLVYGQKGGFDKAQEWIKRAVEGGDRLFGPGHPYSLTYRSNKALYLERAGRIREALATYSQVLTGRENSLGKNHPQTQDTVAVVLRLRAKIEGHSGTGSAALNRSQPARDPYRVRKK
jgi:tetratricopeptide (TPR) repeat protein